LRFSRAGGQDKEETAATLKAGSSEALEGLPGKNDRRKMVCRSRKRPPLPSLDGLPIVWSVGLHHHRFRPVGVSKLPASGSVQGELSNHWWESRKKHRCNSLESWPN